MPKEHKLKPVTSGLAFDTVTLGGEPSAAPLLPGAPERTAPTANVTSHSARVLLAGAGFLADAVRICICATLCFIVVHMTVPIVMCGCYAV
jgi:hypothetical protein